MSGFEKSTDQKKRCAIGVLLSGSSSITLYVVKSPSLAQPCPPAQELISRGRIPVSLGCLINGPPT